MDDFKVRDISLAEFGRKEISIAESEMPGLMASKRRILKKSAFKGSKNFRMSSHDNPNRSFN